LVLDGEILLADADSGGFPALMARLHPAASRVERLRRETPAVLRAFDVLAIDDEDLTPLPFEVRRRRLEALLYGASDPAVRLTPVTPDGAVARRWLGGGAGPQVDGVVAKHRALPYRAGERAMVKVKSERTAECVVAGFRLMERSPRLGSLLLGLYDGGGVLRHVGVVTSFTDRRRAALEAEVAPFVTTLEGHPWQRGFGLSRSPLGRLLGAAGRWDPQNMTFDWVPLRPELVCEVAYDRVDADRFRHPARFRRWRPDRDPRSCTLDQLDAPAATLGAREPGVP
jgi:ATP-dependent DNA ligase